MMVHRQDPRTPGDHRKTEPTHEHTWKLKEHGPEVPANKNASPKHAKNQPPPGKWAWTLETCNEKDCTHWRKMNQFGREIQSGS